jgi:hypothetical protein
MNTPTLFDNLDVPLIASQFGDDTARAKKNGSKSSHHGADKSAAARQRVLDAVYQIVRDAGRPISGNDINAAYQSRKDREGWPADIHFDTPRKRAGELAADGVLVITNPDDFRNHTYDLPALERAA